MNKILSLLFLAAINLTHSTAQSLFSLDRNNCTPHKEVRAMWLTTFSGLDWPSRPATTAAQTERQKKELCQILDQLQYAGINTILFQTRIRSTTAYPSAIEPWDAAFSGTPGKAPTYDPLQFALEECHRRNMELHAWVVAFPICKVSTAKQLGKQALPKRHPQLCQRCGDQWMMDPGVPGTADYIAQICKEIVERYDVDGIHLDYIRYPESGIPFNDRKTFRKYGKGKKLSQWRKDNVTNVVRTIHHTVKAIRPWVKLSCSPVGKYADLSRQSSYGWNARDAVYQEAQKWLSEGIMDMLFPMMYFDGKHFYPFAVDWQANANGRLVVPGLGIYFLHPNQKNWDLNVIRRQMYFLREINSAGQAHFRSRFFTDNVKGLYDFSANDFYQKPAQVPAMTWEDSIAPSIPSASIHLENHTILLQWTSACDNQPQHEVTYNIYYCPNGKYDESARPIAQKVKTNSYRHQPALPALLYGHYAITAVDVFGNESKAIPVSLSTTPVMPYPTVKSNSYLELPQVDGAEFVLLCDITGRALRTLPYQTRLKVDFLKSGCYEVRTLGKKGRSHALLTFWKN